DGFQDLPCEGPERSRDDRPSLRVVHPPDYPDGYQDDQESVAHVTEHQTEEDREDHRVDHARVDLVRLWDRVEPYEGLEEFQPLGVLEKCRRLVLALDLEDG